VSSSTVSARRLLIDAFNYTKPVYFSMLAFFAPALLITFLIPTIASPSARFLMQFINMIFITPFVTGASIFYAHQNLTQRGATVPDSLQAAGEKFFQLSLLVVLLIVFLIPAFILIVPGVYLSIRWSFVFYAIMIECYSASDALSRSWKLTKGHWWLIFRTVLLFALALIIPTVFLVFLASMIFRPESPDLSESIGGAIGGAAGFLIGPFGSIYYVLLFMSLVNMAMDDDER
jgi:Membrane domain of glycerophosphoryl diester phosphodiesterase